MGDYSREAFDPEPFDDMTGPHDLSLSSGSAKDSPADTTGGVAWMPPSFDAAGWIADTAPNTLPTVRSICPELVPLIVGMVDAAYEQGRNDQQKRITARVDDLMRARFGE